MIFLTTANMFSNLAESEPTFESEHFDREHISLIRINKHPSALEMHPAKVEN